MIFGERFGARDDVSALIPMKYNIQAMNYFSILLISWNVFGVCRSFLLQLVVLEGFCFGWIARQLRQGIHAGPCYHLWIDILTFFWGSVGFIYWYVFTCYPQSWISNFMLPVHIPVLGPDELSRKYRASYRMWSAGSCFVELFSQHVHCGFCLSSRYLLAYACVSFFLLCMLNVWIGRPCMDCIIELDSR